MDYLLRGLAPITDTGWRAIENDAKPRLSTYLAAGVVVSLRGDDFEFDCGEDIAIGYLDHTETDVRLYFEESFTFRVIEPDAAVVLSAQNVA